MLLCTLIPIVFKTKSGPYPTSITLCNFMAFLNDKCGHGVGAEYMVDPQNN